jgi:hypothetical protein
MDSIFQNPIAPTPDPKSGHEGTRGGFDLPDGQKETPGLEIGTLPTLTSVKDAPGASSTGSGFDVIAHHKAGLEF